MGACDGGNTCYAGSQGKLGSQAVIPGVDGVWEQLTVNGEHASLCSRLS